MLLFNLNRQLYKIFKSYKFEILIIVGYVITMLSLISWGLPNASHPFPYFMDESHQLQAVRTVIKYATSNYPQQENGPIFHYAVSALLASPFYLTRLIDPSQITSAITEHMEQAKIYMAFRFTVIMFGVGALFLLVKISRFLKINSVLVLLLLVMTPVWISISNYFKYDVPFVFWTLFSFYLCLLYSVKNDKKIFLAAGVTSALALATKISAVPVLIIYVVSFFYFTKNVRKNIKTLIYGLLVYLLTFLFIGIPDIVFLGRSMNQYLYYNIVLNPGNDRNYIEQFPHLINLFLNLLPVIYGHFVFFAGVVSFIYLLTNTIKNDLGKFKKEMFVIIAALIFICSLLPLWFIAANRALAVLPFIVLIIAIAIKQFANKTSLGKAVLLVVVLGLILQIFEVWSWIDLKRQVSSRVVASRWLVENIERGEVIGIENIPVYQMLPDIITREFYEQSYGFKKSYNYKYEIVDSKSKKLPRTIVISNSEFEKNNVKKSAKKDLVTRIYDEEYKRVKTFYPTSNLYRYFTNDLAFVVVGLTAYPLEISVYRK